MPPKFYAVRAGRHPGVYATWAQCQAETRGFSCASFRSFSTRAEADEFVEAKDDSGTGGVGAGASAAVTRTSVPSPTPVALAASLAYQTTLRVPRPAPDACFLMAFDGGARGNPGPAASAAVLWAPVGWQLVGAGGTWPAVDRTDLDAAAPAATSRPRVLLAEYAAFSPHLTNNQAEYGGLIAGLRLAAAAGVRSIVCEGDSLLVVNQLLGSWRVLDPALQLLHREAASLLARVAWWGVRHIPRAANRAADALANEAMDRRGPVRREAPPGGLAAVAAATGAGGSSRPRSGGPMGGARGPAVAEGAGHPPLPSLLAAAAAAPAAAGAAEALVSQGPPSAAAAAAAAAAPRARRGSSDDTLAAAPAAAAVAVGGALSEPSAAALQPKRRRRSAAAAVAASVGVPVPSPRATDASSFSGTIVDLTGDSSDGDAPAVAGGEVAAPQLQRPGQQVKRPRR